MTYSLTISSSKVNVVSESLRFVEENVAQVVGVTQAMAF